MKEREINLSDLFIELLLKWRQIFVIMLLGMMIVGAWGMVSINNKNTSVVSSSAMRTVDKLLSMSEDEVNLWVSVNMSEEQVADVNAVILNEANYRGGINYINEIEDIMESADTEQLKDRLGLNSIEFVYEDENYCLNLYNSELNVYKEIEHLRESTAEYLKEYINKKKNFNEMQWIYYGYDALRRNWDDAKWLNNTDVKIAYERDLQYYDDELVGYDNKILVVRYIFWGGVVFALLYVIFVSFSYVLSEKIHSCEFFENSCGVIDIGRIVVEKNKRTCLIDKLIERLKYGNKLVGDENQATTLIATSILLEIQNKKINKVALISTGESDVRTRIANRISDILKEHSIDVKVLLRAQYDVDKMNQLNNFEGVVIIEEINKSIYSEIFNEIKLLRRQNVEILGTVTIE